MSLQALIPLAKRHVMQGACYGDPPSEWSGEALQQGQCIIRSADDLFRVQSPPSSNGASDTDVLIISNLYLLRQDAVGSGGGRGGGFATLVQSTTAALYLHMMTLDGGRLRVGQTPLERGRGLHTLSGVTLAEGLLSLPMLLLLRMLRGVKDSCTA